MRPRALLHRATIATASCFFAACSPSALPAGHTLEHGGTDSLEHGGTQPAKVEAVASVEALEEAPPPPAPAPPVPEAVIPAQGRRIGGSGPIGVEGLSAEGHWVAYCQGNGSATYPSPRVDDRGPPVADPKLRLDLGTSSETIDALLRADDSGRFLVVLEEGVAWLIDAVEKSRWDLSELHPDLRFDGLSDHRSFAFTRNALVVLAEPIDGKNVLFAVDLLRLERGRPFFARQVGTASDEVVYRLESTPESVAAMSLPAASTNKYWPAVYHTQPVHRCARDGLRFDAYSRLSAARPDRYISYSWLHLRDVQHLEPTARFEPAPGFVFGFEDGWVRRLDTGRVMLVRGRSQRQITSERCGGRILHADEASGKFIIACEEYDPIGTTASDKKRKTAPKYRFDLYVIKPGTVHGLGADVGRTGVDVRGPQGGRYVPIRPGATAALVDLKSDRLWPIDGDARVLAGGAAGMLVRRGDLLSLWLGPNAPEHALSERLDALAPLLVSGSVVTLGTRAIDLGPAVGIVGDFLGPSAMKTWDLPAAPLAVTPSGHVLYAAGRRMGGVWGEGPLVLLPRPDAGGQVPPPTEGTSTQPAPIAQQ